MSRSLQRKRLPKGTDSMSVYIDGTPPAPESVIVSSSIKTSNLLKKTNPSDSQQQLSLPGDPCDSGLYNKNEHLHEVYVTVDGKNIESIRFTTALTANFPSSSAEILQVMSRSLQRTLDFTTNEHLLKKT